MAPIYVDGRDQERVIPLYEELDSIIATLGSVKTTFWPFLEGFGGSTANDAIRSYKENQHDLLSRDETAVRLLEAEFSPFKHFPSGIHSYDFQAAGNQYLQGSDDANLGFPANADFSCGAWIYPRTIASTTIMGKYDLNNQREWRLSLSSGSKLELEVLDETEGTNGDRTGAGGTSMVADEWQFVVVATDNNDDDQAMDFYINGVADGSGNTGSNDYNDSPDTTAEFVIGATLNTTPLVTALFEGRIALPFVCGKVLTATEVAAVYAPGRRLLGLV